MKVILILLSNMVGNFDDETNFPRKLLWINRQVANFRKALANNSLTDIKPSKTQLPKMIQLGVFIPKLFQKTVHC